MTRAHGGLSGAGGVVPLCLSKVPTAAPLLFVFLS